MEAWAKEFLSVWEKNREQLAEVGLHHIQTNPLIPVKEYTLNDTYQFLDGVTAMIREDLMGEGTDVRDMYVNTVFPGILALNPVSALVAQLTLISNVYSSLVLPQIRKKHRPKATEFLAYFYMRMNYDVVKIGIDMGLKA